MVAGFEFAFALVCQPGDGGQDLLSPAQQFRLAGLPGIHVVPPGLEDAQPDAVEVVQAPEGVQRAQRVTHELAVVVRRNEDADPEFEIDYMQHAVGHDDAVPGAVAVLYPFGVVQGLLDTDQRFPAQGLRRVYLFHHEVAVRLGGLLHLRVVIGKVFGWVTAFPAQRLFHQELAQLVGAASLDGILAGSVILLGTQPGAGRAGHPAVAGRSGEVCVVSHGRFPPLPASSRPRCPGHRLRRAVRHRTSPASP